MATIIYRGSYPFKYYLLDPFGKPIQVTEEEFFDVVGYDRRIVPMKYSKETVNRQNFYLDEKLIGYRIRRYYY